MFDLPHLCKEARIISLEPQSPSKVHPLGLGIKDGAELAVAGRGVYRLPKVPTGLLRLRGVTSTATQWLPPELAASAWGALLGRPTLVALIAGSSTAELRARGHDVPYSAGARELHELVLGVVVRSLETGFDEEGALVHPPLAGFARLILQTPPNRMGMSTDAWLEAKWCSSTAAAVDILAGHYVAAGSPASSRNAGVVRALLLTISPDAADSPTQGALRAVGRVLGFELATFRPDDNRWATRSYVSGNRPRVLLIGEQVYERSRPIIDLHRKAVPEGSLRIVDDRAPELLRNGVRDHLIEEAGLTPALFLVGRPKVDVEPRRVRPTLPVLKQGRSAHVEGFGRFEEDVDRGLWLTWDHAGHAGATVKCYKLTATELVHVVDLDAAGNPMTGKHKGEVGKVIGRERMRML